MDSTRLLRQGARGRNQPSGQHSAPVLFLFSRGIRRERPPFQSPILPSWPQGIPSNAVPLHMVIALSLARLAGFIGHFRCPVFSLIYCLPNTSRI